MPNRLASSTSPYLLQHKDNPVDWHEWGDEAFAEAKRRDVPVLLSVGYAACHWCHVMAHESFEDPGTAAAMNEHFVNIKVDREERPDVDAIYMDAVQALTGQGGWPMTVMLTPDRQPFYAGTYFPPRPRQGAPSFGQVIGAVSETWATRRDEVESAAADITARLAAVSDAGGVRADVVPDSDDLDAAVAALANSFDRSNGGFGGAPKFPPSMVLEFLLRNHARTGSALALDMALRTCTSMAHGGIYDQLAGGFARYSVDSTWTVPHFEKMLYDNALLLRVYSHLWRATKSMLAERVVRETAEFLLRDLRTAEGGFASALDADTDGVEGLTYVWTPEQLIDVLGADDGTWAAELLGVTDSGTFEHGSSVLRRNRELDDPDDRLRWERDRSLLAAARSTRPQPARDDKVVAAWNGLAIAALAEAGAVFDRADWIDAAVSAGKLLHDLHGSGESPAGPDDPSTEAVGRLFRVSRAGVVGRHAGVLEDQADVAEGFLALFSVTGEACWLDRAGALLDALLDHFADPRGGFFDTADDAEELLRRPKDATDNATPSGNAAAAGALLSYAALTGSSRHRAAAESALAAFRPLAREYARFAGWGLAVAEAVLDGPREVAIVGSDGDAGFAELKRIALSANAPGLVVAHGPGGDGPTGPALLRGRSFIDGRAAAYVCRAFVCDLPTTEPSTLETLLAGGTADR